MKDFDTKDTKHIDESNQEYIAKQNMDKNFNEFFEELNDMANFKNFGEAIKDKEFIDNPVIAYEKLQQENVKLKKKIQS